MPQTVLSRRQLVTAAGVAPFAPRERRPNILFILPDQMRAQAAGCMGNAEVRTPEIDRLASQGLLFRNTVANTPVCCPARAILMTGQYCHTNGMVANDLRLRESRNTIAKVLRGEGYRTGFIGKWHLDGGPRLPGFVPPGPRRQGFEFWAANECSHAHFNTQYFRDSPEPVPVKKFEVEAWTDAGLGFLRESAKDGRPFFLSIFMGPPHDPYGAPEKYMRMYDPARLTMRPNWKAAGRAPGPKEIAAYYAAITAIDDQVGRMTAALEELGMAEDTIVLFSSDHGDMLGSHGLRLKRKPWEESIRVPGILRYSRRVKAGRTEDAFFSHADFPPTLLGLCGARVPKEMQGADLSRLVTGDSRQGPDSAFFQIFGPYQGDGTPDGWRGVRTRRHMYARFRNKPWVLYDLDRDPYQMDNLAGDPAAASLVKEMDQRIEAWMRRTGDSWDYNWSEPVEDQGRLYRTRTFYTVQEYLKTGDSTLNAPFPGPT
ncbi:MAG: sulfatase [Acidobacteria bacterium]|nr:sulfatase [Acidobacteriota bacterium]